MSLIEIRGLSKKFGSNVVLDDIATVTDGSYVVFHFGKPYHDDVLHVIHHNVILQLVACVVPL